MSESSSDILLISVNIQGSRNLDLVLPFLKKEMPDVLCVQELFEVDLPLFAEGLGMKTSLFVPVCLYSQDGPPKPWGIGLFSKLPARNVSEVFYSGSREDLMVHVQGDMSTRHGALAYGTFRKDGQDFTVGTLHFTWTPDGEADDLQRRDLETLFGILERFPEIIFCGDFNAPRGREIFDAIAARYKDNIPGEYKTSIDGNIHRAGPLPYVVDGLFTTPQYVAENTRLVDGVSDHMAIVSRIRKIS